MSLRPCGGRRVPRRGLVCPVPRRTLAPSPAPGALCGRQRGAVGELRAGGGAQVAVGGGEPSAVRVVQRLRETLREENQWVKMGAHHTLEIELNNKLTLGKAGRERRM